MFLRIVLLLVFQSVAALLVWFVVPDAERRWLAAMAALAGTWVWLLLDMLRSKRLVGWLRRDTLTDIDLQGGLWGELYDRMRKRLRLADRAIVERERQLQDFLAGLQASPNGVVMLDPQGRIEWFNQTAAAHYGLDASRDKLQHFGNLVRDPGFAAYYAGRDFQHDVIMPGRNSTVSKPVNLSVHVHPYGEGRSLVLSQDITAKEQAETMRRDFVANVSHEIRTPLTVLCGFVETLQSLPLDAVERSHYLDLMAQQAQRMQVLVSDLLTLSRLEGSPLPSFQEWVSVDALMAQCAQDAHDLSRLLWTQPQTLQFSVDAPLEIAGSALELQSAMFNLIGNAIRYSPQEGVIDVSWVTLDDGAAVFCVRDSGVGIAPEHIPRLTERFYRVDRSRSRETGGTGLGLAIVKHVAQRHNAELGVESTVGKGSRFCITFAPDRVRRTGAGRSRV